MSFFSSALRHVHLTELATTRTTKHHVASLLSPAVKMTTVRGLASYAPPPPPPYGGPPRSYPSYSIVAESCILNMKMIPPQFTLQGNNQLVLDSSKRGRLLMEFCPRSPEGTVSREKTDVIRFALSAEEVGTLLHQLPNEAVQFSRRPPKDQNSASYDPVAQTDTEPSKVFRMIPGDAGTVGISVDHELDGIGGQQPSVPNTGMGPMAVTAQMGEFQVLSEIMRSSIPLLSGWTTMTNMMMQNHMNFIFRGHGGGGGGNMF